MVLLEFSMYPVGKGESLGDEVARSLEIVEKSGLPYQLHAMGTILEGDWDEVFAVIKTCFEQMRENSDRVSASVKLDYRKGRMNRIQGKVKSIEKRLNKKLHTEEP